MQRGESGATSGRGQWFLHRDDAPSHTPLVAQQFLSSPAVIGARSEWLLTVPYS
jgi:hypothetical protein